MVNILDLADGMHQEVSHEDYHIRVRGMVSCGALEYIAPPSTPAHYLAWADGRLEEPTTPALGLGLATHAACMEPERFAEQYVIAPEFGPQRKTDSCSSEEAKENKLRKQAWYKANEGRTIISSADGAATMGMIGAIQSHKLASRLMAVGIPEATLLWHDPETGLRCRVRPDVLRDDPGVIVDLKSTEDASPSGFARSVAKYKYHWRHALYVMGAQALRLSVRNYLFVAVEKFPPYAIGIYQLDEYSVARGYEAVRGGIDLMARCMKANEWPGYDEHTQTITLPQWAA
jgi:hypothetical protein